MVRRARLKTDCAAQFFVAPRVGEEYPHSRSRTFKGPGRLVAGQDGQYHSLSGRQSGAAWTGRSHAPGGEKWASAPEARIVPRAQGRRHPGSRSRRQPDRSAALGLGGRILCSAVCRRPGLLLRPCHWSARRHRCDARAIQQNYFACVTSHVRASAVLGANSKDRVGHRCSKIL